MNTDHTSWEPHNRAASEGARDTVLRGPGTCNTNINQTSDIALHRCAWLGASFPLLFLSDQLIILTHTNTKIHRNTIISAQLISDKHKYLNPRTSADSFPLTHRLLRLHPLVRSSPPEYKDFKIVGFIILPQENDSFCWMPQTCSLLLHLQIAGCNTSFICRSSMLTRGEILTDRVSGVWYFLVPPRRRPRVQTLLVPVAKNSQRGKADP